MASKRVLLVGLGNYTHPQTRHSIGLLLLDYIASHLNLTWSKNKSINAYITSPITICIDPSSSSSSSRQTKLSKKEKKSKKKEWDFGSESDDNENDVIKRTDPPSQLHESDEETVVEGENYVINPDLSSITDSASISDFSRSTTSSAYTSPLLTPVSTPTLKPKKFKPKPAPVPVELTLLKPLLLMNISGKSVSKAAREFGFSHSNITIIHDDMQRELGKISIKMGGSANGHNGVKSVIDHLQTNAFQRLRIGIGRPPSKIDDRSHDIVSKFVLSRVPPNEMEIYKNDVFPRCKDELFKAIIKNGNS